MFPLGRGIRLEQDKSGCLLHEVEAVPLPQFLVVPLPGCREESRAAVQPGDLIRMGQPLYCSEGKLPVCSPADGAVEGFDLVDHPFLGKTVCVRLRCTAVQESKKKKKRKGEPSESDIVTAAREAGIVDELDGRPLYQKLERMRRNRVEVLLAFAADDDPYTACAQASLNAYPDDAACGLRLAAQACGAGELGLAVQKRRKKRESAVHSGIDVYRVGSRYPARALLKKKLRAKGRIASFLGVQACIALARAVTSGEPQTACVVTVAGEGVLRPRNLLVPAGVSVRTLLELCDASPALVCYGSVMTGKAVQDLDIPICLGTRLLAVLPAPPRARRSACIGCGRCVRVCPRGVLPWYIHEQLELGKQADSFRAESCIGCGACNVVCPAGIDLVGELLRTAGNGEGEQP